MTVQANEVDGPRGRWSRGRSAEAQARGAVNIPKWNASVGSSKFLEDTIVNDKDRFEERRRMETYLNYAVLFMSAADFEDQTHCRLIRQIS